MNNNNDDMLISPENIQNTLNKDTNIQNYSMNQINEIETLTAEIPVQNDNSVKNEDNIINNSEFKPLNDNASVNNEEVSQNINAVTTTSNLENSSRLIQHNNITNQTTDNQLVQNINNQDTSINVNEHGVNQEQVNINYYQEGQVNINNSKTKNVYMNGLLGAIILLTLAVLHYFLIAPYLEKILIEQSFYETLDGISAYFFGGNVASSDIKIYAYTFAFLTYTMLSFELLIYFTINLVKKGDLICDFKKHISTLIIITSIISIIVIVLFVNTDIDLLTPILRIITLDGHQLKFVFSTFTI